MSEEAVTTKTQTLPVLPLKNTVLFPFLLMPLSVGRSASLAAVQAALGTEDKEIILVSQKDPAVELPGKEDLYSVGTKAVIRCTLLAQSPDPVGVRCRDDTAREPTGPHLGARNGSQRDRGE